ncbi:MAG TPA: DnaJ domain-containing protein [Candidatus Paceibacterota bacterium]|nr:DnaJ domain-containing protein [Candidatus Paceibacterota bacterium]
MTRDPYTTLGISRNATVEEIKKAYRKLAHQHHPDKTGGDDKKFKEINEAYQILSDPKKRSSYDTFGHAYNDGGFQNGQEQTGFGGGFDFNDIFNRGGGFHSGGFEDIFDLFSDAFSTGTRYQEEPLKGEDIYLEVPLIKKDLSSKKIFEFEIYKECPVCSATGLAKGAKLKDCEVCKGAGQIRQTSRTPFGSFTRVAICQVCRGKRKIPERVCDECRGEGRIVARKQMEIHIPKSVDDGYTIVVPKGGNVGKEGKPAGDLIITLRMK